VGAIAIEADFSARGPALALCGPSGAGKTTILNMIAGLDRPDSGRIAIDGALFFDSAAGVDIPARRRRIGYVFQEPRLFPHLSVEANLRYGARFAPPDACLVKFDSVVGLLGIDALLKRRPNDLSGGEKQRVAIGRALLSQPRALLLDEPLSALDDSRRGEILALIETLRDTVAIPMILVSHRVDEVERLASEVALVEPGRVVRVQR
jgi:molybdate transport system ATP-binding protein